LPMDQSLEVGPLAHRENKKEAYFVSEWVGGSWPALQHCALD